MMAIKKRSRYLVMLGMMPALTAGFAAGGIGVAAPASAAPGSIPDPFPPIYKVVDGKGAGHLPSPKTVVMGWAPWNTFACDISESLFHESVDAMVANGLRDAGYQHVSIDDCWQGGRDAQGKLQGRSDRFPRGMPALAQYFHQSGMKFQAYTSASATTCGVIFNSYPPDLGVGSLNHETIDAQTFADWGADSLKHDMCATPDFGAYDRMQQALANTGRPIVYMPNFAQQPGRETTDYLGVVGHSERVQGDIKAYKESLFSIIDTSNRLAGFARPGYMNDMDMLEVGNFRKADGSPDFELDRINMGMWALMVSPMMIGADVRNIQAESLAVLKNRDVIGVAQDPLNTQGVLVKGANANQQVWVKPLYGNGERAVALLNRGAEAAQITVNWSDLALQPGQATVRDLWKQVDLGPQVDGFTTSVPATGVVMLKIQGKEFPLKAGDNLLSAAVPLYQVNGWGPVEINMSNGETAKADGQVLAINGTTYPTGFGTSAPSQLHFRLNGACSKLTASVGVDDQFNRYGQQPGGTHGYANVIYEVWGDGRMLYQSGVMQPNTPAIKLSLDVSSVSVLKLIARPKGDTISFDYADWIAPTVTCSGA